MSLILDNARLTNDPSQQTYTITVANGLVKSIVPTSHNTASASQSAESGNVQAERIDVKGYYVGECPEELSKPLVTCNKLITLCSPSCYLLMKLRAC